MMNSGLSNLMYDYGETAFYHDGRDSPIIKRIALIEARACAQYGLRGLLGSNFMAEHTLTISPDLTSAGMRDRRLIVL
jgi:hypothetical protein